MTMQPQSHQMLLDLKSNLKDGRASLALVIEENFNMDNFDSSLKEKTDHLIRSNI